MKEVTEREYKEFLAANDSVTIEGTAVRLVKHQQSNQPLTPSNFQLQRTSVWSFEHRGTWATHRGDYRGNWAPEVPRNLVLRYSRSGDTVLDQMVGSGTTLVECKLLGRRGIGVDSNPDALMVAWNRLDFAVPEHVETQQLFTGDARDLDLVRDASIDLIATHPPYGSIVRFSKTAPAEGDLSSLPSVDQFIVEMRKVAAESYRVLKPGRHCGILIGDTHAHGHYVPLSYRVLAAFLEEGFILREQVIKQQWHTQTMRGRWRVERDYNFLLTVHEHLFIFRKPGLREDLAGLRDSMKWSG